MRKSWDSFESWSIQKVLTLPSTGCVSLGKLNNESLVSSLHSSTRKDLCEYMGATWAIQGNLNYIRPVNY